MHSTDNLEDGYIGSGTRLRRSVVKYGKENFKLEILEFCSDRESLKKREAELITEDMLKDPMCINLKLGGEGGFPVGCGIRIQHQKVDRKARAIKSNKSMKDLCNKSKTYRDDYIRKKQFARSKSKAFEGMHHSTDAKNRIGEANAIKQLGSNNSQFGTSWIYHVDFGNKKCKREELPVYLAQGWIKGRKMTQLVKEGSIPS
jgi:hypothetical protein